MNIVWLIFAHYIGDIALQSDWQAQNKGKYWYVMLSHCIIWTACISVALQWLSLFTMWKVLFLIVGHFMSDKWKCEKPKTPEAWKFIYPDQAWHHGQLLVVYLL